MIPALPARDRAHRSDRSAAARARRRRRRSAGAILTEAVIVLVFFVTVFGCASFVHRLHAEKLRASRTVREQVWTEVMAACPGGSEASDGVPSSVRPETERLFGPVAGIERLESPVTLARRQQSTHVTPGPSLHLPGVDLRSASTLTCNERVVDLDPQSAAELAWHGLTGW